MITYPVSQDARFVVYRVSTHEIIKRDATWPRTDGMQIVGQDPDYVFLEQKQNVLPDYDPRYYILTKNEIPDLTNEVWLTAWATQKRPVAEITVAVENAESVQLDKQVRQEQRDKLFLLGLTVLFRQTSNQTLTAKEIALKDMIVSRGVKVWQNDAVLQSKITAITAGSEPDIDAGWATSV